MAKDKFADEYTYEDAVLKPGDNVRYINAGNKSVGKVVSIDEINNNVTLSGEITVHFSNLDCILAPGYDPEQAIKPNLSVGYFPSREKSSIV